MTQLDLISFFSPIFFSFEFLSFCLFMISTVVLFGYLSYLHSNITFFYFFFIYLYILKFLLYPQNEIHNFENYIYLTFINVT